MSKDINAKLENMQVSDVSAAQEDNDDEELIDMPVEVTKRVIGLKKLQTEAEAIDEEYKVERLALEKKFRARKQPLLDQRTQIVAGLVEPVLTPEEEAEIPVPVDSTEENVGPIVGIPGFWGQCLTNNGSIGEFITDEDIPVLNFLADISCSYNDDMSSFTISFLFNENPYFSNSVLTKTYNLSPDLLDEQAPSLTSIVGTEINWKEGNNLCVGTVQVKQKGKSGKRKGQIRFVSREEPKPSFFHFFGDATEEDEEVA